MDYGTIKDFPLNPNPEDSYIVKRCFMARTGRLTQYYTFYEEVFIVNPVFARHIYRYIKNLSLDYNKALSEATALAGDFVLEVCETPRPELNKLDAFGLNWKRGKKNGLFYAHPNNPFWNEWKKDKEAIKASGFWVSKKDGIFYVFFKDNFFINMEGMECRR